MATFVVGHSDELANVGAVLVQRFFSECQFLLKNGSFLDSPVQRLILPLELVCFFHIIQALVPEAILKERLDQDTLENMGLLVSKQAFQAKYVKVKTRLLWVSISLTIF